jgi:hypothetical protein
MSRALESSRTEVPIMTSILLFAGAALGVGLLIAGIAAMQQGDAATGWKYMIGAVAALAFTIGRGRRLQRDIAGRRDE